MLNYIRNLVAGKELNELALWRTNWECYRRWLSEFPMIAMMLDNMNNEVRGKESMDACHPPGDKGPWTLQNLRWHMRRDDALKLIQLQLVSAQTRVVLLEKEQAEALDLILSKNREVNELRFVCGEAYQQLRSYRNPNTKALENLYAASKGTPLPHTSFMRQESFND